MWAELCLTHHHMRGSSCHFKKKPTIDFLPGEENKDNVIFQQELIVFCLFFHCLNVSSRNSIIQCHPEMFPVHLSILKYNKLVIQPESKFNKMFKWLLIYIFKPTQICPLAKINLMNKKNCIFGLRFKEKRKTSYLSLLAQCYYVIYAI